MRREALPRRRCKFGCELSSGEQLRKHVSRMHPEYFTQVRKWLGDTDAKLRSAQILGQDGMKGCDGIEGQERKRGKFDRAPRPAYSKESE